MAVLPFEPLTMMRPLTHRGLTGDDFTQCSVALFYAMSSLAIKEVGQSLFYLRATNGWLAHWLVRSNTYPFTHSRTHARTH